MGDKLLSVCVPITDIFEHPESTTKINSGDSQLLFGETVKVIEEGDQFHHITSQIDGYTGFVNKDHLTPDRDPPTHFIDALGTHIYKEPDFKTRPLMGLHFLARLKATGTEENGFTQTQTGWVPSTAIKPVTELTAGTAPIDTGQRFLGCPYLYAGRSAQGLDCSALVQLALLRAGIPCPRDSSQQIETGEEATQDNIAPGDLVFFKAHVGMMIDKDHVINATSRSMDVRIEPLNDLIDIYDGLLAVRRV